MDKDQRYEIAYEVEEIAARIIDDHHNHLAEAKIKYLFKKDKWVKKDKVVLGQAKLASEDTRFIARYDFVIIINLDAWNISDSEKREALIDHELSHCGRAFDSDGNNKWCTIDHDVQEFIPVVRRHGLWEEDLQLLMKAVREAPFVEGLHNEIPLFKENEDDMSVN